MPQDGPRSPPPNAGLSILTSPCDAMRIYTSCILERNAWTRCMRDWSKRTGCQRRYGHFGARCRLPAAPPQTKQDLIETLADHLEQRLRTERAPPSHPSKAGPDPFGRQFEDLAFYQLQAPDVLAVYREFVARAPRDPAISKLVTKLHANWKASIVASLTQAKADDRYWRHRGPPHGGPPLNDLT
jgi:hypothetical protein